MKLVHCVGWYMPDSIGGSETYVHGLTQALLRRGIATTVMAPASSGQAQRYVHDGVEVIRYPVRAERSLDQHEGRVPHAGFDAFRRQLEALAPDVFHLHSLSYGCGVHHLRHARSLGLATLATFHVPDVVCARGTMMRFSREVCDGRIDARRCVPCWLEWRGVPEALAIPAGELLRRVARGAPHAPGRLGTVLRAPARIDAAARRLDELADLADRVIAVSAWLRDALLRNGVPQDKLVLCRQGVAALQPPEAWGPIAKARSGAPLRIGFFGRGTKVKGVDRLVRAVRSLPRACAVELRVHALANLAEDRAFMAAVRAQADGEPRIQFAEPVPQADVQSAMRQYDVVAVPSMWLETGPLVAMEALAAGIPVLGSDLGGLRELIEPGVTGWLVPAYDVAAWSRQIAALAEPHAAPMRWERERTPIITMDTVAERMLGLYRELVA